MGVQKIQVIDSHTGGEPTRTVIAGGPDFAAPTLAERRDHFRREGADWRRAVIQEPRGSEVLVGAWLVPPSDPSCVAGVIFFNNVGTLGMCGHGTMGVAVTLAHLGRIQPGRHRLETPVGVVPFELHEDGHRVTLENVPSYRLASQVSVTVPGRGVVSGEIAWGGNWFFLVEADGYDLDPTHIDALTDYAWEIRQALNAAGITGADGAEIDHIELQGPATQADARNFVLCPGREWDRSPCGTGTSAKIACLAAEGKLAPGQVWRQESVIGTQFEATYRIDESGRVIPIITGSAWVTSQATLWLDSDDPFCMGIPK